MKDISEKDKVAIGMAFINASQGDARSRVDWTGTVIALLGTGAKIRGDRLATDLVIKSIEIYASAVDDLKQDVSTGDAIRKCIGILLILGPLVRDPTTPYGILSDMNFNVGNNANTVNIGAKQ